MIERLSGFAFLGSTAILCLLLGLCIWVIAKAIERLSFFQARRDDLDRLGDELVARLRHGDFDGADLVLAQSPSIEAAVVRPALEWLDGGSDAVEAVLDAKRAGVRRELEHSLLFIGIIGRLAPWMGLFGTIIGVIETLRLLEQQQGKDVVSTLAHGVSTGLIPAGAGVVVGLATAVAHSILIDEVMHVEANAEILSKRLVALMRFKKYLAAEFGLAGNGLTQDPAAALEPEPDEEVERARSVAELD